MNIRHKERKYMKKLMVAFLTVTTLLFLANWGSREASSDELQRESINFSGTLETWQGQRYAVENISIDHRIKQLPLYEKPAVASTEKQAYTSDSYALKQNPAKDFVKTKIDLQEIKSLEVPDPERPWVYRKKNGTRETEYLEIIVTSKGMQGQPDRSTNYLIEANKKLYCDRMIGPCPEEREVPLVAMKKLTIESFKYRTPEPNRCQPQAKEIIEAQAIQPVA